MPAAKLTNIGVMTRIKYFNFSIEQRYPAT